jgi:hypothetical protein
VLEEDQKNGKSDHAGSLANKDKNAKNELSEFNEIESTPNMIVGLREELEQKEKTITDLRKYKQLAHQQEHQLSKLNELIDQLHLENYEPENNIPNFEPYQKLENANRNNVNSDKTSFHLSYDELEDICGKLSNQIEVLEDKIHFLEQNNTALNQVYAKKMAEIEVKQKELDKT